MRKVNLHSAYFKIMKRFRLGDIVRISQGDPHMVYVIKSIKKVRKGGNLYLLEGLLGEPLRLYYEKEESLLEKIS